MVLIDTFVFKCGSGSDITTITTTAKTTKTNLPTPQAGGRVVSVGYMINTVDQEPFSQWVIWTSHSFKIYPTLTSKSATGPNRQHFLISCLS